MRPLIIVLLTVSGFTLHAQGVITLDPIKKADKYFQEFSYAKAAELYKIVLLEDNKNSVYITNQIALSYRNLNMADSSEVWFKKAIGESSDKPDNYFYLGEALMINGKYEEAKFWFHEYENTSPDDPRASKKLEAIDNLEQFKDPLFSSTIESATFNSPGLDFSPAFYKDGIVFISSRPRNSWVQKEFNWDQSGFLDLYTVSSSGDATYYSEGLNTPYHEGPLVFFNNDKSVVYTRNNYDGKKLYQDEKGVTNLKLYFANWDEKIGKWKKEQPFQHNNDDYSNGSPAISEDGKTLIFSSNKPGGYGESDLYICFKEGDKWSEPKNLGSVINTKGRDGFPFLAENQLFFASDGGEGLGGLDIFAIKFISNRIFGEPKNIGEPFNSRKDDFGLILREGLGFFTSNREKSTSDDIYKFYVEPPKNVMVIGEVFDRDLLAGINESDVFFKNKKGEVLYTRSKENGEYQLSVPFNTSWNVYAGKYKYDLINSIDTMLNEEDTIYLEKIFLSMDDSSRTDSLAVDDLGVGDTLKFEGDTLKFDMVYFDLDKSSLRNRSKEVLNYVANFMIEHEDIKVILTSHTDSRANDTYNDILARKRSNAVAVYLIGLGVNPGRIEKLNLGETRLVNNCDDGVECSENEHQFNRRTEFIFIKTEETK